MSDAPSQKQDKFIVRLPDGMREALRQAAEANNRSMNAEIVSRLADSFKGSDRTGQMFQDHIDTLMSFSQASPSKRDEVVVALLENLRMLESLSQSLRRTVQGES